MKPVSVVVVEDSPTQRAMLVQAIEQDSGATVLAQASSCRQAVAAVARHHPDVVTMDLEIPGGDGRQAGSGGIAAIAEIMASTPTPILVLSGHVGHPDSLCTMHALAAGATEALPKPRAWTPESRAALGRQLRTLQGVAVVGHRRRTSRASAAPAAGSIGPRVHVAEAAGPSRPIIGLVASTGGPMSLRRVIGDLRGVSAPVIVVQHLHREFSEGFVRWLEHTTGVPTHLLERPETPLDSHVYIAPGGLHVRLSAGGQMILSPTPEGLHRPSGNELLDSLAAHAGAGAIGAVLTGMGDDGAAGLKAIAEVGGACFAQDPESCAVYGMPRAAMQIGAVAATTPLSSMAGEITRVVVASRAVAQRSPR